MSRIAPADDAAPRAHERPGDALAAAAARLRYADALLGASRMAHFSGDGGGCTAAMGPVRAGAAKVDARILFIPGVLDGADACCLDRAVERLCARVVQLEFELAKRAGQLARAGAEARELRQELTTLAHSLGAAEARERVLAEEVCRLRGLEQRRGPGEVPASIIAGVNSDESRATDAEPDRTRDAVEIENLFYVPSRRRPASNW